MTFRLLIAMSAKREIDALPKATRARVEAAILALAEEPRPAGVKLLHGPERLWRIRVGDFRVVYEVKNSELVVLVVKVGNRREVYR